MIAISTHNINKRFPGVQALRDVSVEIEEGTCHALMGENGAGKSTLGKIIAGVYTAESGTVSVFGKPCAFRSPADAFAAGVGIVHQELLFCENLSVAENLCLSSMPTSGPFVDFNVMEERAKQWLAPFGLNIDPRALVGSLSIGQQQMVQIAGAIGQGARVLIFDEPTSSLSHGETLRLFDLIRQLLAKGITCIYVSHRMSEIFELCSSVSVLRDGEHVFSGPLAGMTEADLVAKMIGRELQAAPPRLSATDETPLLQVNGLTNPTQFQDISFGVRPGEIVGLAGLVGSGRTEVARAIFGLDASASGDISVAGQSVRLGSQDAALKAGIGLIPEDRKREGLLMNMNVGENSTLSILPRISRLSFINRDQESSIAGRWKDVLRTKAPTLDTPVLGLSGGNQQKVVLTKWLAAECRVLILDEPTRGVDVGAKEEIHEVIRNLAREGRAVLVISSELPELLAISSRILVMAHGRLVGEIPGDEATETNVMNLMATSATAP